MAVEDKCLGVLYCPDVALSLVGVVYQLAAKVNNYSVCSELVSLSATYCSAVESSSYFSGFSFIKIYCFPPFNFKLFLHMTAPSTSASWWPKCEADDC